MLRLRFATAAAAVMMAGLPLVVAAPAAAAPGVRLDPAAVDRFVEGYRSAAGMPGVVVAITHDATVVHVAGYGVDSTGARLNARTPMRLASVSKSFTALAVMQQVEAGRVALDRPVRDYLPEFRMADRRATGITVRQILGHASGITQNAFPTANLRVAPSLREAVAQLATARLGADPGTAWSYHNANYWIAARLVEVVSGVPFTEYLRGRIFGPLGMSHTVATITTRDRVPGLADGHNVAYGFSVSRPEVAEFDAGSGGIVSTAEDMAAWLISQNNGGQGPGGGRVLSAAGVAELHRPSAPGGEYGLGWFTKTLPSGARKISHGGTAWTFTSHQVLLPDSGYGIVVLSNSRPPYVEDTFGLVDGLVAMTRGETPRDALAYRLIAEAMVTILTLVTVAIYVVVVVRARVWAHGRLRRRVWAAPLRLLPHMVVAGAAAAFPALMRSIGWDINWHQLYVIAPSFAVWLTLLAAGAAAGTIVRLLRLVRAGRSSVWSTAVSSYPQAHA
ncbi:serine hydrolase domain-containing protein [Dactylosporangium sp. NPDC000555]|uniref:serine hydrolase domain-containing protein n=1 Tax=Dactylosporangium sp. NPDC000555 TaxID=3154260 RepID=UPI003333FC48